MNQHFDLIKFIIYYCSTIYSLEKKSMIALNYNFVNRNVDSVFVLVDVILLNIYQIIFDDQLYGNKNDNDKNYNLCYFIGQVFHFLFMINYLSKIYIKVTIKFKFKFHDFLSLH